MKKTFMLAGISFFTSLGAQLAIGCGNGPLGTGPLESCAPLPDLPAAQLVPLTQATGTPEPTEDSAPDLPLTGTVQVTGRQVLIRYDSDGTSYLATYDVQ